MPDQQRDSDDGPQRALVTGATSGMGRAIAQQLAADGLRVIVHGRDAGRGAQVVEGIEAAGGQASFAAADLADPAAIKRLADTAGEIDVLVNNAGFSWFGATADLEPDRFDALFASNVRAPYFLVAAFAPGMAARGSGSIINISSMASQDRARRGSRLRRDKGRARIPHPGLGRRVQPERRAGQRGGRGTGLYRRGGRRTDHRARCHHTAGPSREHGGDRRAGQLPRLAAGQLYHRRGAGGRWRPHGDLIARHPDMPGKAAKGSTPQERSAAARARLLAAASELFYSEGVQSVGIDRVIEHAGVAKATLYSAFGSKEELVRAYLRAWHAATMQRMSDVLDARYPTARERLVGVFGCRACRSPTPGSGAARSWAPRQRPGPAAPLTRSPTSTAPGSTACLPVSPGSGCDRSQGPRQQLVLLYDGAGISAWLDRDPSAQGAARAVAAALVSATIPDAADG